MKQYIVIRGENVLPLLRCSKPVFSIDRETNIVENLSEVSVKKLLELLRTEDSEWIYNRVEFWTVEERENA